MTIRGALATVVSCAVLLAAFGAGAGFFLGVFVPDYYRGVFHGGREPGFDPVSVGLGQGLIQGAVGGVVVGVGLVTIFTWRQVRRERFAANRTDSGGQPAGAASVARVLYQIAGTLLILGFCTTCGVIVGLLGGEQGAYHRRFLEEREALAPVLADNPAFAAVEIREKSDGGAYLSGEVPTAENLARLRSRVEQAIGERRGKDAMAGVGVTR